MANYDPELDRPSGFPWGCLIGGCFTVLLFMIGGVAIVGFASYRFYQRQVATYTSDAPLPVRTVSITDEEFASLEQRIEDFQEQVTDNSVDKSFILTEDELNALIGHDEELAGRVSLDVEPDQLLIEVSIPLSEIPGTEGRYLNAKGAATITLLEGQLTIRIDELYVNGQRVPDAILSSIEIEQLAEELATNPEAQEFLDKFHSINLEKDRIVLIPVVSEATKEKTDSSKSNAAEVDSEFFTPNSSDAAPSAQDSP